MQGRRPIRQVVPDALFRLGIPPLAGAFDADFRRAAIQPAQMHELCDHIEIGLVDRLARRGRTRSGLAGAACADGLS